MKTKSAWMALLHLALVVLLVAMVFLLLPSVTAEEEEQPIVAGAQMVPVTMLLREGYEMSPEPPDEDDVDQTAACPNGYVGEGLLGYGFIKRLGTVYPRYIGTWASDELKDDLIVDGTITFEAYYFKKAEASGTPNGKIIFSLMRNDQPWIPEMKTGSLSFRETVKKISLTYKASGNLTPLAKGDTLQLRVTCEVNGNGGYIYYGSSSYPSGVRMTCSAISIKNIVPSERADKFEVEYTDSFGISPAKMGSQLLLDGVALESRPQYGMTPEYNRLFIWNNYDIEISENEQHIVTAIVSYIRDFSGTENETVIFELSFSIKPIPTDWGKIVGDLAGQIIPILIGVALFAGFVITIIAVFAMVVGKIRSATKGRGGGRGKRGRGPKGPKGKKKGKMKFKFKGKRPRK